MTDTANPVRGRALYLECIRPGESVTTQILILPEGVTSSHKTVPMTVFRRRLSSAQPRKTWKMTSSVLSTNIMLASTAAIAERESAAVESMLKFVVPIFKSLKTNGYTLYKQPIVVEVTAEDLEHARLGKTPYKALARVWKTRKHLGFPQEYIHSAAPASF